MSKRIENPALKPYVYSLSIEKLENCELFVNTFGKGFAKKRLDLNFSKLYTNEKNRKCAGYHRSGDLSITLCAEGKDGELLSVQEFQKNERLKTVALHETIHAILEKLKSECKKIGIIAGSGILEHYENGTELGRGINEGYTNWICEKAGMKTVSYLNLTNFVRMIELAIGPENTMQMGYGDITNNISKLLRMTPEECKAFLAVADQLYIIEDKHSDIKKIISLTSFANDLESNLEELNEIKIFVGVEQNPDYINFANSKDLDVASLETKIEYFKDLNNKYLERIEYARNYFENILFTKYFQKDFEEMSKSPENTEEIYKKFMKLDCLLAPYDENLHTPKNQFKKEFQAIKDRFLDQTVEKIRLEMESVEFTISKYQEYKDFVLFDIPNPWLEKMKYELKVAKLMCPEDPKIYVELLRKLDKKNKLEELSDYTIIELETDTGGKEHLYIDKKGENNFSSRCFGTKKLLAKDEIEDVESLFDFTLDELTSIQTIVNKFLKLKEDIKRRNAEAQFEIINNIIVVSTKATSIYFVIEDDDIKMARSRKIEKNEFVQEREEEVVALINPKKNPISEFFLAIKRKLLRQKSDKIYENSKEDKKIVFLSDEKEDFNNRISDMSNYSPVDERSESSYLTQDLKSKDDFYK